MKKKEAVKLGIISIDSGLCWIGDPGGYIHPDDDRNHLPEEWENTWVDFIENSGLLEKTEVQFNYDLGIPGLGVAFSTGWGDGNYEVMAEKVNGRIKKVWVKFF